jgi:hypothetical protein
LPLSERYLAEQGTFDCSIDDAYSIMIPVEHLIHGMKLHWSGIEGHYIDKEQRLIAFDPSVQEKGPSALLIQKDTFQEFLDEKEYAVVWTLLGEKRTIGGMTPGAWRGMTVINGTYRLKDEKIVGKLTPIFEAPTKE